MPLLPQKRAADSSPLSNNAKHQKRSRAKNTKGSHVTAITDLTAQNDVQSPLLRLPAELRNIIWKHAFGDMVVHVESRLRLDQNEEYDRKNPDPWFWFRFEGFSRKDSPLLRPVCRRFFAETTGVFWSSCVFSFHKPMSFRALARSGLSCVPLIQRIAIDLKGNQGGPPHSIENFPWKWRNVFTISFVGRFRSLEGVNISELVEWDFVDNRANPDILNNPMWKATKMSTMIGAFQQHKLKAELTSINIQRKHNPRHTAMPPGRRFYWDTVPACEAIRQELLKHKPRRNPRRGN